MTRQNRVIIEQKPITDTNPPAVIATKQLSKRFSKVQAVDNVSLTVEKGEIYGFIGLNGAGKTTTIRMLLGMLHPTAGEAYLFGKKVQAGRTDLWAKVGYLVEIPYAYPDLSVWENLEIFRRLRRLPDRKATECVIQRLGLTPYRQVKAKNLSHGNAQRLGIARALIHQPELLILDEPTLGLDPAGIVEIRALLLELVHEQGVTVFLSSHILSELYRFATRIGIIHQGHLLQELDTEQLKQLLNRHLVVATRANHQAAECLRAAGYPVRVTDTAWLEISDERALDQPEAIATLLVQAGYPPKLLKVEEESLEAYFLRLVGADKP